MIVEESLINLLVFTMLIIFSTLPLYVSVKILGGKTSLLKTFLVREVTLYNHLVCRLKEFVL